MLCTSLNPAAPIAAYQPSAELSDLIREVAHHPDLDFRLWAGMTILINLDILDDPEEAEEVPLDVVGLCLNGADYRDHLIGEFALTRRHDGVVTDIDYEDAYGGDLRAAALLTVMKTPDLLAREFVLSRLACAARGTAEQQTMSAASLLQVAQWIAARNYTHH